MPGDAAVFADGLDVALDIGDVFQRAGVADLDLTLVGVEPVGDGDILDIAAVVHVDIHGLALLHRAGHIGVIYRRGLLIAGRRGSVAVVAGALAGAHGEYARRESEAERRFENKVFLHFIALLVQAFALRLLRSFLTWGTRQPMDVLLIAPSQMARMPGSITMITSALITEPLASMRQTPLTISISQIQ